MNRLRSVHSARCERTMIFLDPSLKSVNQTDTPPKNEPYNQAIGGPKQPQCERIRRSNAALAGV